MAYSTITVKDGNGSLITLGVFDLASTLLPLSVAVGVDGVALVQPQGAASGAAVNMMPVAGVRVDTPAAPAGVIDGDVMRFSFSSTGRLWTSTTIDAALPAGSNVIGQVTANAGTNLNTSTLALEAGGNLAAAAASLSVMDDWDESDRAKVNPIAGQAGVQGGSGLVTALTQRVVLATDVPLPAGTNGIGKLTANDGIDIGDVTINNAAGAAAVNVQDGGNSLTVDGTVSISGTVAATQSGTWNVGTVTALTAITNALPAGNNNIGDVDVLTVNGVAPAFGSGLRGATVQRVTIATDDVVPVSDNGGSLTVDGSVSISGTVTVAAHAVTNAGTFVVQENGAALTSLQLMDDVVFADDAPFTPATSKVSAAGLMFDDVATDSVDEGDIGIARMSANRVAYGQIRDAAGNERGANVNASNQLAVAVGNIVTVSATLTEKLTSSFNRPGDTTAYAANDAVADNTTAGSVTRLSFSPSLSAGTIRRVKIRKSDQTVATPTVRLWLYDADLTPAAGDNAAFTHPAQDSLGYVDVAVTNAGTDDAVGWANCDIPHTGAAIKGLLQTLSAFTPANAETFTVTLWDYPG